MTTRSNYKYVFFNSPCNKLRIDKSEYNMICVRDLEKMDNVQMVSYPLDWACYPIRYLFAVHHSAKLNSKFELPFKNFWFPFYFKNKFNKYEKLCFVFARTLPLEYMYYLRKKYPNAKFVKITRDLIENGHKWYPEYTEEVLNKVFDIRISYDKNDAKRYGIHYWPQYESKIEIKENKIPKYDVFFVGKAKDRLPRLMNIYNAFKKNGYTCNYYLTEVKPEQKVELPGIEYATRELSYREVLERISNARCILDINQKNAVGYTARVLEAIMYNKLLLTDNMTVKNMEYYDTGYMQCFEDENKIDFSMFEHVFEDVDYEYEGEFSPVYLLQFIDKLLVDTFK